MRFVAVPACTACKSREIYRGREIGRKTVRESEGGRAREGEQVRERQIYGTSSSGLHVGVCKWVVRVERERVRGAS